MVTETPKPLSILFLQNKIPPYRIPVYNFMVQSGFTVTVAHTGEKVLTDKLLFKEIKLDTVKIGPFNFPLKVRQLTKNYDAVIVMFDIWWLSYITLVFHKNSRIIFWGHGLGKAHNRIAVLLRKYFAKKADAIVFYTASGKENFIEKTGIEKKKCFVAQNTLFISNAGINSLQKKYFLYTGRLQKRKNLDELIVAYNKLNDNIKSKAAIFILGDGDEVKSQLQELVSKFGLQEYIHFLPANYNENDLKKIFDEAYAYVSPAEAGLGVVHSFAYGVPVITKNNISNGPEFFYCNRHNSYVYSGSYIQLAEVLELVVEDEKLLAAKSQAAFNFYNENLSMSTMAKGFIDAINYTLAN